MDPPSLVLLPYPIILIPREKSVYFVPPETFNLVAMMSNPMMLLMVFGGGMMLVMPYLMVGFSFSIWSTVLLKAIHIESSRFRHNGGVQGTSRKDQRWVA